MTPSKSKKVPTMMSMITIIIDDERLVSRTTLKFAVDTHPFLVKRAYSDMLGAKRTSQRTLWLSALARGAWEFPVDAQIKYAFLWILDMSFSYLFRQALSQDIVSWRPALLPKRKSVIEFAR